MINAHPIWGGGSSDNVELYLIYLAMFIYSNWCVNYRFHLVVSFLGYLWWEGGEVEENYLTNYLKSPPL